MLRQSMRCSAGARTAASVGRRTQQQGVARSKQILRLHDGASNLRPARLHLAVGSPPRQQRRSLSFTRALNAEEAVKVPQMAESISEGTLKQWLKKKGDSVEQDEEVATIETDKIDVSVNAPKAGVITELLASEEDTVTVGQDLFTVDVGASGGNKSSEGESKESTSSEQEQKPSEKEETKDTQKQEPKDEQPKQPAKEQPPPQQQQQQESATESRRRKSDTAQYEKKETEPSRPSPSVSPPKFPEPTQGSSSSSSTTSGGGGTKSSIKVPTASSKASADGEVPFGQFSRTERRVKMNSMRRRIAERLKQSQNSAAALTTFNEIDMSALIELRKKYKDRILKEHGVKLGFMSLFAKAACLALREFPAANAAIEGPGPGDQVVYRDFVDLSVAVATPKGLVTPVVRNAESMSCLEIEQAIAELGKKARDNKLTLEDMSGGTFTISNGGVFGSLYGTPIINLPQAAVLGMHSIKDKPYVVNGKIEIRPIMIVALTYDHRLLDGREAVSVLVRMKEYLEDPGFMMLAPSFA